MSNNFQQMLKKVQGAQPTKPHQVNLIAPPPNAEGLAAQSQKDGQWNDSLLKLTLQLVRQGKTDQEIHASTDLLTTEGYSVTETRKQVQAMINGARTLDSNREAEVNRQVELAAEMGDTFYIINRKEIAAGLKIPVGTLDHLRKQQQQNLEVENDADNIVEPVTASAEPVNPINLADDIEQTVRKHIALKHSEYATAITLWALSTWQVEAWRIMPHLFFRSLTKGSGKTTALQIVEAFSARSYVCANITPAALFRVIEQFKPTLLLDEVDRYLAQDETLNGIMNAGHTRRTATVTRCEKVNDQQVLTKFNVFGGKCLAGIGKQLDTMMDRSIIIRMEKRLDGEVITKLPLTFFESQYEVRCKIARFAEDNFLKAKTQTPVIPNLGNDRAQDNWTPLFIIADLIGGDWPERCLASYKCIETISQETAREQEPIAVRILRELAPGLETRKGQWLAASELRDILVRDPEAEFFEFHLGKPISAKSIKKHLTEAGVEHKRDKNGSYYSLLDLNELAKRYVQ
jgi:hypothetical protein